MKSIPPETDQNIKTSENNITRRITRKQGPNVRGMATRTRSQSSAHIISPQLLKYVQRTSDTFSGPYHCCLTGFIKQNDPGANSHKMIEKKHAEVRDFISRGTFRDVLGTEQPDCANMITTTTCTRNQIRRRQGRKIQDKVCGRRTLGNHERLPCARAQSIQCVSIRTLLVIAKAKGFRVWIVDVKLAYLQSDKPFIRKIFITNSVPEFDLLPQEFL